MGGDAKPKDKLCDKYCNGCTVYKDRPTVCREFECLWLKINTLGGNLSEELRPNNTGIMITARYTDGMGHIIIDELEEDIFDILNMTPNQKLIMDEVTALIDNQTMPTELVLRSHNWEMFPININRSEIK